MKKILSLILASISFLGGNTQDLHYTRIQDLKSLYNQSLQLSRNPTATFNYRTLDYAGYIAFRTASLAADVPLLNRESRLNGKGGYVTASGAVSSDNSNSRVLKNNNAMLGLSYTLPVNAAASTYISAGFQGAIFQNQINLAFATFPDQYDEYRLVPGRATNDPSQSGTINYFSVHTGVSAFHQDEDKWWYAGVSARHLNQPESGNITAAGYKLPSTLGVQMGAGKRLSADQRLSLFSAFNWKAKAYEHIVNLQWNADFNNYGMDRGIGGGVGYRIGDAVIPNFEFRLGTTVFAFAYDININQMKGSNVRRTSLEASIRHSFQ